MKGLLTDKQTLDDLKIFSSQDVPGIFDIYDHTRTRGGQAFMKEIFLNPVADPQVIKERLNLLNAFAVAELSFPFEVSDLDMMEKYITDIAVFGDRESHEPTDKEIQNGVYATMKILRNFKDFISQERIANVPSYQKERAEISEILFAGSFSPVYENLYPVKLGYAAVIAFDRLFRVQNRDQIIMILKAVHALDVYLSVSKTASINQFCFPEINTSGYDLTIEDVYYPYVKDPVRNTFSLKGEKNICFLTGANMAGKSTFLRSIGTAIYLAHMGFPVAAKAMHFSVMDGIYSTINLPDDLGNGASHFFAEVLRLKHIARELHRGNALFVIFDELFRGTNVTDAHEATAAVAKAFTKRPSSKFIISSHIIEAANDLKRKTEIEFNYLPTRMKNNTPEYSYKIQNGVSSDRHGMLIIKNEGILDILKNGRKKSLNTSIPDNR